MTTEPTPHPLGGNQMPRFGGPATMMRLPDSAPRRLDVGFLGVPLDIGTSHRSGARFGRRVVELAPQYDPSGNTALPAANLAFEIRCVIPGVECRSGRR